MLPEKPLRKADLLTGCFLFTLGLFIIALGLRMPIGDTYGGVENTWYVSPAAYPILLGAALLAASSTLVVHAARQAAHSGLLQSIQSNARSILRRRTLRRAGGIWLLIAVYAALLKGHFFSGLSAPLSRLTLTNVSLFQFLGQPEGCNYVVCSALFLMGFMGCFYGLSKRKLPGVLLLATTVPILTGYAFHELLRVPLP